MCSGDRRAGGGLERVEAATGRAGHMICSCKAAHTPRRVVLTGGPGAGKTAILELIRQQFCQHVRVLPEAAGILFGGGFPRNGDPAGLRVCQRAIFHVQWELESWADDREAAIVLCDRGVVDGAAYWPGPGDFWTATGRPRQELLHRYAAVIHLRTPPPGGGYTTRNNPLRLESAAQAAAIDERILDAWEGHPRRIVIGPASDFLAKAAVALAVLRSELPECCRRYVATGPNGAPAGDRTARPPGEPVAVEQD